MSYNPNTTPVTYQGNPDEINFGPGWLGRVNPEDIPQEYHKEAEQLRTAELNLRDVTAKTVDAQQLALDSINRKQRR